MPATSRLVFWLGVGHGGHRAAEYVKTNLFQNLIKHPKFLDNTKEAIRTLNPLCLLMNCWSGSCSLSVRVACTVPELLSVFTPPSAEETYKATDADYLKAEHSQHRDAGSTASTAVYVGDRLLVANVGDSRAVICRGGKGTMCLLHPNISS